MEDGPGGGPRHMERGLVEARGFSPSQHPGDTGDVDTEREGWPDGAGIRRATEEEWDSRRERKEGWKEGNHSGKKRETDEEWSAEVREA